ncbi:MAG: hypothetical protein ABSF43_03865 [Rectinemataceae bacterium]
MTRLHVVFAAIALALLPLATSAALEAPTAIRPSVGLVMESLLDPNLAGHAIPSPSLNVSFGCGVVMPLTAGSRFSFEPSADIYSYNAEYTTDGQALPTDESFSSAFVIGLLLDAPVVYSFPAGQNLTFGVGAGLCLDIRVAFLAAGAVDVDTPRINGYFWDKGRFITPSTLVRGEYKLTDRVVVGLTGRVLWPIYNLWTGEGYGFFDQGMYLLQITMNYKLGKGGGR